MKKTLLIVNPVSGKMKAKSTLLQVIEVLQRADCLVTVMLTTRRGHAVEIAKSAQDDGYEQVVCFGGDGTLNEVITGLKLSDSSLPLGYIPAGSTNDFANGLSIPSVPVKAAESITNGTLHNIDIGRFDKERYFSYIAAFGIFTATSYNVPQNYKNVFGHAAYVLGGIAELGNSKNYNVKLTLDNDKVISGNYIFGSISNSTSVAGVVKLKESLVDISDGLFEVGLIKTPNNIADFNKIINALATSDFEHGGVEIYRASKVLVECENDLDWTLDGEHATAGKTIVIENIHNGISLIR